LDVVLLEARDRVGGRTWTREWPEAGVSVELGGTWFARAQQPALAAEIARYGIAVTPALAFDDEVWLYVGVRHAGPEGSARRRAALSAAQPLVDAAIARLVGGDDGGAADLDVASDAWIEATGLGREAKDMLLALVAMMAGARPAETSIRLLLDDVRASGYRLTDAIADMGETFADGSASLYEAIAKDVRGEIRLSAPVRRVAHDHTGVAITTEDGGELRARAAVIALPLNCWADLVFDPPLPAPKARAATEGHAGLARKVVLHAVGVSPGLFGLGFESPLQSVIATKAAPRGTIVTGFDSLDRIVDPEDVAEAGEALRCYVPEARALGVIAHDWVADPWAKGSYLATRPGWAAEVVPALPVPEGRLTFAGSDIAREGAGWIEGAITSGREAAVQAARIARA